MTPDEAVTAPDAAQVAAREVRKRLNSLAIQAHEAYVRVQADDPEGSLSLLGTPLWTLADVRTLGIEVLRDMSAEAAREADPHAYLGSATFGVLRTLEELGAMPRA